MDNEKNTVIEPEILDETGQVISATNPPKDHARPQGDNGGLLSGMLVLAVGFFTTVAVILFSILILCPLMLLGRLLHFEVRSFRR
ncbi:MAG: hypothetical protein IKO35_06045 [Elusimicrobiaceae bacterium]|nr:hypothetical protein [Elusimicrobiaceae bacterium]